MKTLVLALGNPLCGDDGWGALVVAEAQRRFASSPLRTLQDVVFQDGASAGFELALLWEGFEAVVLVDVVRQGHAPGEMHCLSRAALLRERAGRMLDVHAAGLLDALALSEALGSLPAELCLIGAEPDSVEVGAPVSEALVSAIPRAANLVLEELARLDRRQASSAGLAPSFPAGRG